MVKPLRRDLHTLSGVYALNALEADAERDRFERHLNRCQSCSSEVRGLRETTTRLGMAAARRPPPTLRSAVMAAVAQTRQVPAVATRARPERRPRWLPRLVTGAAAVGLAAAVTFGVLLINTQHRLNQAQARNQAIAAVLAAPDARVLTGTVASGGTAVVVVSEARHQLIISTAGLRPLPPGKVYQAWLIGPPRVRSAGLLPPAQRGRTLPVLASGLAPRDTFGLTVEPAGGTAKPTTSPIVLITLPA